MMCAGCLRLSLQRRWLRLQSEHAGFVPMCLAVGTEALKTARGQADGASRAMPVAMERP